MTKKILAVLAVAVLAIAPLALVAQERKPLDTPRPAEVLTDAKFALMAASSDLFEIRSSELAMERSADEHIKKMAKQMITDHTMSSNKLKKIAAAKKLDLPTAMATHHATMLDNLTKAKEGFDKSYVDAQLAAHKEAVSLFKAQAASGKDEDLRTFASETLPTIQMHLEHFQKMDKGGDKPAGEK